jgi:hypothetical protein
MTETPEPEPQRQFQVEVPDLLAAGVYSNFVSVWHTPFEFTLDFAVLQPAQQAEAADGGPVVIIPARVVVRVKIPPALLFELMQAMSLNEKAYEQNIGPVPRPGRPSEEPPLYPPEG